MTIEDKKTENQGAPQADEYIGVDDFELFKALDEQALRETGETYDALKGVALTRALEKLSPMLEGAGYSKDDVAALIDEILPSVLDEVISEEIQALDAPVKDMQEGGGTGVYGFYEAVWKNFSKSERGQLETLFPGITVGEIMDAAYTEAEHQHRERNGDAFLDELLADLKRALPYIGDVLKAYKKKNKVDDITLDQFMEYEDPVTREPAESLFSQCLKSARKPSFTSLTPREYIVPNSIVSNSITKGLVNAGEQRLDPSRNHRGKYYVYTTITLDPNKYTVTGDFTNFDRRVFNGVCSLIKAGCRAFTPEMVFRAMNGLTNREYVSPGQAAAVAKSLEKMRDIDISLDATEEFQKKGIIGKDDKYVYKKVKFLKADIRDIRINGVEVDDAFVLDGKPLLYEYAEMLNQIVSIPIAYLAVKDDKGKRIYNTDAFTAVKEYLLRRIEKMKSDKKSGRNTSRQDTILIETFYREAGVDAANRKATAKARSYAQQCGEYWIKEEYIKDLTFVKKDPEKKNSTITKILIEI